ncbi:hypothetical protein [Caldimonas sp. KR1-144]|uniref:hypothetical protein n=1 Tax=Caldimonas sp. KR1-144 TaxID=3400911 RepID=UPI003C0A805C
MNEPAERIDSLEKTIEKYSALVCRQHPTTDTIALWDYIPSQFAHIAFLDNAIASYQWGAMTSNATLEGARNHNEYRRSYILNAAKQNWWLVREIGRFLDGSYISLPEPILQRLLHIGAFQTQHFLHLSVQGDDAAVAYTASRDDALRDRQLRLPLGRYLRKHYSWLPDHEIQYIDAQLRACMNANVELLEGFDAMLEVYMAVSPACMSRDAKDRWGLEDISMHPLNVYAPEHGWRLAITRNAKGEPASRAVVWINPDDPTDKRWGRAYGDKALSYALDRSGFKNRGFEGATLKTVLDQDGCFVVPYIDASKNNTGGNNRYFSRIGALRILTQNEWSQLGDLAFEHHSDAVRTEIKPLAGDFTCAVTGERHKITIDNRPIKIWRHNTLVSVHSSLQDQLVSAYTPSGYHKMLVEDATLVLGEYYANDEATFAQYGITRLSERFYPDAADQEQLFHRSHLAQWSDTTGTTHYLKPEDCVDVIDAPEGASSPYITSMPRMLVSETIRVHGGRLATKAAARLIQRTPSGAKVIMGIHDVEVAWNGQVDFSRNLQRIARDGFATYIHRRESLEDLTVPELGDAAFEQLLEPHTLYLASRYRACRVYAYANTIFCPHLRSDGTVSWKIFSNDGGLAHTIHQLEDSLTYEATTEQGQRAKAWTSWFINRFHEHLDARGDVPARPRPQSAAAPSAPEVMAPRLEPQAAPAATLVSGVLGRIEGVSVIEPVNLDVSDELFRRAMELRDEAYRTTIERMDAERRAERLAEFQTFTTLMAQPQHDDARDAIRTVDI